METKVRTVNQAVEIFAEDMPLHCPPDNVTLWNMHPKVFLPLDADKKARCPYCSTLYQLKGDYKAHH
ncbi:zinc-finger domain-containing protein [Neisseria sp. Ec49-e6-T10]|uniref:zinc-finger domain-containing protein n=1 Tax=Neisseria sp. Ec49-e6-T10 TaxID=3140744 RepID=UPI003EB84CDB